MHKLTDKGYKIINAMIDIINDKCNGEYVHLQDASKPSQIEKFEKGDLLFTLDYAIYRGEYDDEERRILNMIRSTYYYHIKEKLNPQNKYYRLKEVIGNYQEFAKAYQFPIVTSIQ